jgi:hypothetical protein
LTVNGDGGIGTYKCAVDASRAVVLHHYCEMIATTINLGRQTERILRTGRDAKFTSLANVYINDNRSANHILSCIDRDSFLCLLNGQVLCHGTGAERLKIALYATIRVVIYWKQEAKFLKSNNKFYWIRSNVTVE